MEGVESKSQSQGQDSQIMPGSSITPAENVEGFQQCVKEILNLIEQDGNFSEMTSEIYDSKKSKLTTLVTNLSKMHGTLADQHVHLMSEVNKNLPSLTKSQLLDSSDSSSPQVTQMFTPDQKSAHKFMTPIGFDVLLSSGGGGSYASRRDGSDSSFSLSSDSESESSVSINKLLISPLNDDSSKVKETDVLVKKISVLEEEICCLNTKIQTLSVENTKLKHDVNKSESDLNTQNALFEAEKSKVVELEDQVSDLLLVVSDSNLKIKKMGEELKAANDEISEVKSHLSSKSSELESIQEKMVSLQIHINSQKDKVLELQEEVDVYVADIFVKDDQITELNTKIDQSMSEISVLKSTHSAKEETWKNDIKMSKTEVSEKCKLIDELNQKHDIAMTERDGVKAQLDNLRAEMCSLQSEHVRVVSSFDIEQKVTSELKEKVVELEKEVEMQREVMTDRAEEKREVIRQLSFSLDHYMSGYKQLRQAFVSNKRRAVFTT